MARGWGLTLVLLAVVLPALVYSLTCPADCVNGPPAPGGVYPAQVAHKCNCSEFYLCIDETTASDVLHCPPDTPYFDKDNGGCLDDDKVCVPIEVPSFKCEYSCSGEYVSTAIPGLHVIAEVTNCSQYYACGLGGTQMGPYSCPADKPAFNGVECGADKSECCSSEGGSCEAFCTSVPSLIADPYDCTAYYYCAALGVADPAYHFTCDPGENFDPETLCSAEAPCNVLCTEGGGGTTPSGGGGGNCEESMACTAVGFFPKCTTCEREYFHCVEGSGQAIVEECPQNLCFSTDPTNPYCILP